MIKLIEKIFVIGMNKTGISSMLKALEILGYKTFQGGLLSKIYEICNQYDALGDALIIIDYKNLDKHYPNSKFILTERNLIDWLESCKWYYSKFRKFRYTSEMRKMRFLITNSLFYNKRKFKKAYFDYNFEVLSYFNHRNKDLLKINIFQDNDIWIKLCNFLNIKEIPNIPFPHENLNKALKIKYNKLRLMYKTIFLIKVNLILLSNHFLINNFKNVISSLLKKSYKFIIKKELKYFKL